MFFEQLYCMYYNTRSKNAPKGVIIVCFDPKLNITNLPNFTSSNKFCAKSNFHMFVQKSHEFYVMVNMNDICSF